jgi:hypothetical protein
MANNCRTKVETGLIYGVEQQKITDNFLPLILKTELPEGSIAVVEMAPSIVPAEVRDLVIGSDNCGYKSYPICCMAGGTEIEVPIDLEVACSTPFDKCITRLRGGSKNRLETLEARMEAHKASIQHGIVKKAYERVTDATLGGVDVTAEFPLTTVEEVMAYVEAVHLAFNKAKYLKTWNGKAEVDGQFAARHLFLDEATYMLLQKGMQNNIGCCSNLVPIASMEMSVKYMSLQIHAVENFQADRGLLAMALYAPRVIMPTACQIDAEYSENNKSLQVDDSGVAVKSISVDLIESDLKFGLKLIDKPAVQYVKATTVTP